MDNSYVTVSFTSKHYYFGALDLHRCME